MVMAFGKNKIKVGLNDGCAAPFPSTLIQT
jgi:hypothetical protein